MVFNIHLLITSFGKKGGYKRLKVVKGGDLWFFWFCDGQKQFEHFRGKALTRMTRIW